MFFPVFWDLILFFIVIIEAKHTFFLIEPKVYNNLIYSINNESTIYYKSQEIALNKNTTQKIESNNIGFELEKHICNESDLPFISKYYGKETDTTLSLNIEKNINKLSFLLLIKANKCILESSEESPVKLTVRIINNLLTNKVSYKEIDCECRFVSKGESNNTNNFNLDCERDSDIIDIKGFLNSNENGVKATNSDILTHIFTKTEKLEPKPPKGPFLSSSKGKYSDFFWKNTETLFGEKSKLYNPLLNCKINRDLFSNEDKTKSECDENEQQLIINIFHRILKKIIECIVKN